MKDETIELCKKYCYTQRCDCEHCPSLFNTCVDSEGIIRTYNNSQASLTDLNDYIEYVKKFFKERKK